MNFHKREESGPQPSSARRRVRPPGEPTPGESLCKGEDSVKGRVVTGTWITCAWSLGEGRGVCMGSQGLHLSLFI